MIWVGVSSLGPPPIWKAENAQCDGQVVHNASAAAIFMGWYLPSTTPSSLPMNMLRKMAGARTATEMMAVRRKAVTELWRLMCQAENASMMMAPVTSDARITCGKAHTNTGLVNRAQMSVSWVSCWEFMT